jgi:hypothetical protein
MKPLWSSTEWIDAQRKKGIGEGEGAGYQPWLNVRNCPSHGLVSRVWGYKAGRVHHLMSRLELACFFLLDRSDDVVDIREQFPLHPLEETREIAAEIGCRHPTGTRKHRGVTVREDKTMTTDFRVILRPSAGPAELWIQVKPSRKLHEKRALEKLEIERRFAERRGAVWQIVTERELPRTVFRNLEFVSSCRTLEGFDLSHDDVPSLLGALYDLLAASPSSPVTAVCARADKQLRLRKGSSLTLVWHAVASRTWLVDLTRPLNPDLPLSGLAPAPVACRTVEAR